LPYFLCCVLFLFQALKGSFSCCTWYWRTQLQFLYLVYKRYFWIWGNIDLKLFTVILHLDFLIKLLIDIILFHWSFQNPDGIFSGSVYSLLKMYFQNSLFKSIIMWRVDMLLGGDCEIYDCTAACKQRNGVFCMDC
jgi:hypothetical protein